MFWKADIDASRTAIGAVDSLVDTATVEQLTAHGVLDVTVIEDPGAVVEQV